MHFLRVFPNGLENPLFSPPRAPLRGKLRGYPPNERKFRLPIHVSLQQLKQLDEIVDRYAEKFLAESERLLEQNVDKVFNRYYRKEAQTEVEVQQIKATIRQSAIRDDGWCKESRTIVISLSHGRQLEVKNFTEAAEHPGLDKEIPRGLELDYKVYPLRVRVKIDNSIWLEGLEVSVKPNDSELAQAMFGSLSHWASDVAAPFWHQRWRQLRLLFFLVFLSGLFMSFGLVIGKSTDQSRNKQEAHQLLEHGIDSGNEARAISLILALESGYAGQSTKGSNRGLAYFVAVLFLLSLLIMSPANAIGLWRGKIVLAMYRGWTRFVSVTIPLFVVGAFVKPWVINWLTNLFEP